MNAFNMIFQNYFVLIFFISSIACVFSIKDELGTVIAANVLFRHGHRTPTSCYPSDPYNNLSYWPEGWGQLTNTGKGQEYELGKWLRKRYQHLLSDIYSRNEIHVVSTDVDRTLMSAEANLAGLYPPKGSQQWNDDIKWQPIPVHTVPEHLDSVLAMRTPCPRYRIEYKKVMGLPQVVDLLGSFGNLFDELSKHTGEKVTAFNEAQNIYSTMYIETLHNYTLPEWTKAVYPEPLASAAPYDYVLETYTSILKRLKSGPLLKDMLHHFKVKLGDGQFDETDLIKLMKKQMVWLYSAHDETIGTFLSSLGVFNFINPPFASAVLVELRQKNKEHFITVSYHNTTMEPPFLLTIPGCSALCPYKEFVHLTKEIIPYDWETECHTSRLFDLTTELPYNSFAVFVMVTSTLLVFLLLASMSLFWQKQKPTRFYRKLKTDSI